MTNQLLRTHRFLVSQSFYPILLATGLALSLYLARVIRSGSIVVYANLVWNLILAWVPYAFSILAASLHRLAPRWWWLLIIPAGIWLLFFPNAPYIVTDFLHLTPRQGVSLWYDILLLATFSFTGVFLTIASLRTMQALVKYYLGAIVSWLFVAFSLSLGGLGIYLGRFERWNSWDLLLHPRSVLADVAKRLVNPFDNLRFFGFTILFTAFLLVCYLMFVSTRGLEDAIKE
jgi:uncharacterized membrane protein